MSGFIYVWRDAKRNMYYVGCHWGSENDGYICSSTRMRNAYRRRPSDFRRRVVQRIATNRQELLTEEHKWLAQIKDEELGKKFYNMSKKRFGHWSTDDAKREQVSKKLLGRTHTDEVKNLISAKSKGRFWITDGINSKTLPADSAIPDGWRKGRLNPKLIGRKRDPEVIAKYTESRKNGKGWSHTDEARLKMSSSHTGLKQSDSHRTAISRALKGKPSNNPFGRAAK